MDMVGIEEYPRRTGFEIAVIGMAGRFPGAADIHQFWINLKEGIESITFFSEEELEAQGVNPGTVADSCYVKTGGGLLEGKEYFDAAFFDYNPREAEVMDPQVRIFHECAWTALENAGYNPESYEKLIGLYAGATANFNWEALSLMSGKSPVLGGFLASQLVNKDYMTTRISYKLHLKGPAVSVQTACSTSLVAIHMACRSLLSGECDMALAGGVTISIGANRGYMYQEGMIASPDGHCRAFDTNAMGTVPGEGVGVVVLKSLEDAAADGDFIHALVKSSAINNDGVRKVSYTAPSVEGQAEAISAALHMAEVEPESIGFIETHGTGTLLGDPIEIEALKLACQTDKKQYCAIGSVKTNIGHLDSAAGVAGFIKAVLALYHRLIPPSLHFNTPNPKIDFHNSPFYVNNRLLEWKNDQYPLRAGISSFGIGGTNAHVVLEEWRNAQSVMSQGKSVPGGPPINVSPPQKSRQYQLILLSAKTESALEKIAKNLAAYLKENPGINLADAAYTLQTGRKVFQHRGRLVCSNIDEAIDQLSSTGSAYFKVSKQEHRNRPVFFMFSGLGAQYVNMGQDLYRSEPVFREEMDQCFEILKPLMDCDLKEILYPSYMSNRSNTSYMSNINQTEIAQMVIFIFEYALAKLLIEWGIKPRAMIGYSFGEYAAACVSGVFSLENALKIVVSRTRLIQKVPEGVMLSVPLPGEELAPLLKAELSIAIDNGPSCIVAGSNEVIESFERQMKERRLVCMRVPVSRAIHSKMMEPILKEFEEVIKKITLNKPQIPYISNVTGDWLTPRQVTDPAYWAKHLRDTVRFADGIKRLVKAEEDALFIEIGPGRDLSTLVVRHFDNRPGHQVINIVRHPQKNAADVSFLLNRIGELWQLGVEIDWDRFYPGKKPHRIPLPTYPFEGHRYWIDGDISKIVAKALGEKFLSAKKPDMADWFYIPSWKRFPIPAQQTGEIPANLCWLVFIDGCGLGSQLVKQLEQKKQAVVTVKTGNGFIKENHNQFTINPREDNNYHTLFNELRRLELVPDRIVHLWSVTPDRSEPEPMSLETRVKPAAIDMEHALSIQDLGFYSLLTIAQAIGKLGITNDIQLTVVTNNLQEVTGKDGLYPEKATGLGPVKVIPTEYANIKCRSIDVILPSSSPGTLTGQGQKLVRQLWEELISGSVESAAAYRGDYRWIKTFEPIRFKELKKKHLPLKQSGVYLITGGTGGIGLELAQYLAKEVHAKLVLTSRTEFPPGNQWEQWLTEPGKDENLKRKIQKIKELEERGAKVLVLCADVSNPQQMQKIIARAEEQFHAIDGVIHCAGLPDGEMIQRRTREKSAQIFKSKIQGTLVLDRLLHLMKKKPGFFLLCSSVASILPMLGQVGYSAANDFLDAFAHYRNTPGSDSNHMLTVSVNWDRWRSIGIANILETQHKELTGRDLAGGITSREGVETFRRILANTQSQVVVSPHDIGILFEKAHSVKAPSLIKGLEETVVPGKSLPRPQLDSEYTPPGNKTEETLANLWARFFGYEKIGTRDDFFELGGDSLKALIILPNIHKKLNVEIPIAEFFNRPTIEGLVEYIEHITEKTAYVSIETAEEKEYYSLASAQKRLYILQQMDLSNISYNQSNVVILEGELEKDRLERTFKKLIERHEGLRTSFEMINGEPVQRVHAGVDFEIEYYCAERKAQSAERQEGCHAPCAMRCAITIKDFIRPFDLAQAPLLRVGLIKLPVGQTTSHILVVDMHHIIADGISIGILKGDFMWLYGAVELPALRFRYRDFSEWQKLRKEKEAAKSREAFWLKEFEGEIPVLNLPTDYARPELQEFKGNVTAFEINMEQLKAIKALARAGEATLYMLLLSIYTILLAKLGGQEDIVLGTPTAGRRHPELQPVIGMFANTLALRNYPVGEKTSREFFAEVKERTLQALENQDYPFEDLVEQAAVRRDLSRNPIFDVMFVLQNMETKELEIPGLKLKPYEYEYNVAKFDLTLTGMETGTGLLFTFEYSTSLFKEAIIGRFIRYFKIILSKVLENHEIKLGEIEIIPGEEKKELLYDFNNTYTGYPGNKTVHQLFAEQVEKTPGNIALIGHGGHLSYKELNEKSTQLAHRLRKKGVKPDTIVGIMVERSLYMIVGILAILKAGGGYLPVDPDYPEERINYMLADSHANVLVTTSILVKEVKKLKSLEVKKNFEVIFIDFVEFSRFSSSHLLNFSTSHSLNLAYIIYTSGTTGKPKGMLIEHKNVVSLMSNGSHLFDFDCTDVWTMFHSYNFDFSVWEMYGALLSGGKLLVIPKMTTMDTPGYLQILKKENVSVLNQTPSAFYNLMHEELKHQEKDLNLEYVIFGGEALKPGRLKEWKAKYPGTKLINMYGITETTVHVTFKEIGDHEIESDVSNIGKPIPTLCTPVMDKYLNLQPRGIAGELCVSGAGVGRGYLNRPELTAEKFEIAVISHSSLVISSSLKTNDRSSKLFPNDQCPMTNDRLYRSGDLARQLPNGEMEYRGRLDQQVKIRGFRIEPGEIESRLLSHENVKEAVVISREDERSDKYLCAYIVPGHEIPVPELREYLSKKLPDYMMPAYFVQMEQMPLTPNGKLDRKALPEPGIEINEGFKAPATETEKKLAEIWAKVLGINTRVIGRDANFFQLGGHSLRAITVVSHIHKAFHVKISLAELFKTPTIGGLALYIAGTNAQERHTGIEPVEEKEYYTLSSAQKRLYILHRMDMKSLGYNMPILMVMEGDLNKEKPEGTFKKLIARHESLRTSFHMVDEKPVQKIYHEVNFEIEYFDFKIDQVEVKVEEGEGTRGLAPLPIEPANRSSQPAAALIRSFVRPFDLSHAPLLRVGLIKLEEDKHIFMADMHHIISDGISMEIFIREFVAFYRGDPLPELKLQYKNYSEWQNSEKEIEIIKKQQQYWLKQFEGEIPVIDLPTDYVRPVVQGFEGSTAGFEITHKDTNALKEYALKEGSTLYMVLFAIFNIFLSKISSQEEIMVGTPTAGRKHADLQHIIGIFINTLPLKNHVNGQKTFKEFLQEVKGRALYAFDNQDYQYEDLVTQVAVNRDTSRNPLFDVMFILQYVDSPGEEIPGLKLKPYEYEKKTSKFDLILTVEKMEEKLLCWFEYSTKLFKEETMQRFIDYFKQILSVLLKYPGGRISQIEIISEEEKRQVLYEFNDTQAQYPKKKTIHQLFEEQAERTGDKIAAAAQSAERCTITYRELNKKSNQLAQLLGEKGVTGGTIAAIMVKRSVEMVAGILGILKTGGVFLPIDTQYPAQRVSYMLKESGTHVLLTCGKAAEKVETDIQNIHLDRGDVFHGNGANPAPASSARDPAYIIYTSGTAGRPKGTVVLHRGLVNLCCWHNRFYDVTQEDNATQYAGFSFDASVWELFPYLIKGACIYIIGDSIKPDIKKLSEYFLQHRISISFLPTQFCQQFMEDAPDIPSLRILLTGGDKLNCFIRRDYRLFNNYGPTENTVVTTAFPVEARENNIPIGKPIDNTGVYILNKDSLQLQPVGVAGELCISGSGLALGYLNNPELTAEKFIPNPYLPHSPRSTIYRSGDRARWLPKGNIQFLGRIDDQLKIRGFRIESGEIENVLLQHEDIKEAIVMARGDQHYLCAYIVPRGEPTLLQLRDYLSAKLPDYMIPAYFVLLEKLPLTPNGKPDRRQLPEPEEVSLGADVKYAAPTTPLEKKLVESWESILGRKPIGINDDFFLIGGDSIKAIQVASRMNQKGYRMEMRDIFRNSIISELALQLRESDIIAEQSTVTGVLPLTPIQVEFFKKSLPLPHHYNQAVMLYSKDGFEEDALGPVFGKIQEHHDALRMTFKKGKTGEITQTIQGLDYLLSLRIEDLRNQANAPEALVILTNELQESIDLERGPLMKVGLFHLDDGDRLVIAIHHLVIDGISWRILFEDIETLYQQFRNGEPLSLPPKTHSFKTWAKKLSQYANSSSRLLSEKTYWRQLELAEVPRIPTDFTGENAVKNTAALSFRLNEKETVQLLTTVHEPFGTEINDILLAALGMGIRKTYGFQRVLIALEGHGREDILDGVDINRTVGWFTTVYPVVLDVSFTDTARQVIEVKENLHRVPNRGINYGILKYLTDPQYKEDIDFRLNPRISFNYLGQFDSDVEEKSFGIAREPAGNTRAKNQQREFELDVSGIISANRLVISIAYSKKQFRTETIETLMKNFKKELRTIISFCVTQEKKEPTPSDMDYKNLSIEELDSIFD